MIRARSTWDLLREGVLQVTEEHPSVVLARYSEEFVEVVEVVVAEATRRLSPGRGRPS